jgi:hypothetical protein
LDLPSIINGTTITRYTNESYNHLAGKLFTMMQQKLRLGDSLELPAKMKVQKSKLMCIYAYRKQCVFVAESLPQSNSIH